jgi:hypothetical protein
MKNLKVIKILKNKLILICISFCVYNIIERRQLMNFKCYVIARPKDFQSNEWVVVAGFVSDKIARVYREHVSVTRKNMIER